MIGTVGAPFWCICNRYQPAARFKCLCYRGYVSSFQVPRADGDVALDIPPILSATLILVAGATARLWTTVQCIN